jgi:lysophospholipase L1-like esterase
MQRVYPTAARLVCLGDSITQGDFGASYVSLLAKRLSPAAWLVLNAGINGDLAVNALARVNDMIAAQPRVVTILIGTNDVLASMGPKEFRTYVWMGKIKQPPGSGDCLANVAEIVRRLQKETEARIAVLSIPVISEDLDHEVNRRGDQYSDTLRELAGRLNVDYLPLRETQKAYVKTTAKEVRQPYENGDRLGMAAMAWSFLGLSWDTIAEQCGNQLSIDNIHSNSVSAAMIADLIEEFVHKGQAAQPDAAPL